MSTGGSQLATCIGVPGSKNRRCSCSARAISARASFHIQTLGSPNMMEAALRRGGLDQRHQRAPAQDVPIKSQVGSPLAHTVAFAITVSMAADNSSKA